MVAPPETRNPAPLAGGNRADGAKATSLASRKFDFEDMINADPRCPKVALKVVRSYLPFIRNFETDFAYRSIIDLRVDTALGPQAIIDARRALVELGYFVAEGKTGMGAERFRLSFAHEGQILDHRNISRDTLRRQDAERKERQRIKRQSARSVTKEAEITNEPRAYGNRRDVIKGTVRNYLEHNLEGISSEERERLKVGSVPSNGYAAAKHDDLHIPFPAPSSEDELASTLSTLFAGCALSPLTLSRMRTLLSSGRLTPAIVQGQRIEAA